MSGGILTAGDLSSTELPQRVLNLAERLSKIHGRVTAARETSGIQLYMGCPRCLELEGERALTTMKFSVNASRFFVTDQWARRTGTYNVERSASCMKCKFSPNVEELLTMSPLTERGHVNRESAVVVGSLSRKLVPDGNGHMVPPGPGKVQSLLDLPKDHPGRWYIESRGYDILTLEEQFGVCWCYEELPASTELNIFYANLPKGFRNTPQGRVIFFASMYGALMSWQGRIPEYVDGNHKYYWHPYQNQWTLCEIRDYNEKGELKWMPTAEIKAHRLDWNLNKYKSATHSSRNETLFGLDAAISWSQRAGKATCLLMEGPLDAGRFGAPAVAQIGSSLSPQQANMLLNSFRKIVYIQDKGEAGEKSLATVKGHLEGRCELIFENLPDGINDPGDLPQALANEIYLKHLV
jgi:hypothetical protein